MRAQLRQAPDIRPRDARVQNVSNDGDSETLDFLFLLTDRVEVEQALRRVLVIAVARVNHVRLHAFGQQRRRAGHGVAHDHEIHFHRFQVQRGIDERFALLHARGGHVQA